MKRIVVVTAIAIFAMIGGDLSAQVDTLDQIKEYFVEEKYFQVQQDNKKYYILSSSPFKDNYAKRNMVLLSKAALYRFIKEIDKNVTGLKISEFSIKYFYEEKNRLFAISFIEKKNVIPLYEESINEEFTASLLEEISRLDAIDTKTKVIHEQLKDLYFLVGDIDNYEKQTDILMEIIFSED